MGYTANTVCNTPSEAAVELIGLRYGTSLNIDRLQEIAEAMTRAQEAIATAAGTLNAIGEASAILDVPRINAVLRFVQGTAKCAPAQKPAQPENKRFALDAKTREEIRYRHKIGVPTRRLSDDFGVSRRTIGRYVNNA